MLAVVLAEMNVERTEDVKPSAETQLSNQATKRTVPDNSLIGSSSELKTVTAGELEIERENAKRAEEEPIASSGTLLAMDAADLNNNRRSLPGETARFRPSASVQDRCRTRPVPTSESCRAMSKFLEELAREERDFGWATQTEARIRAVIAARQDGTQIRALECRYSKCAIETETPGIHQHLSIFRQAEQEAAGVVDDGNYVLAWEEDPARGAITITEVSFTRRFQ